MSPRSLIELTSRHRGTLMAIEGLDKESTPTSRTGQPTMGLRDRLSPRWHKLTREDRATVRLAGVAILLSCLSFLIVQNSIPINVRIAYFSGSLDERRM